MTGTTASAESWRCRPLARKPGAEGIWFPDTPRIPSEIGPPVRAAIRDLIGGKSPWPLVLLGPAGVGKTCTALCLLDFAGGVHYGCEELVALLAAAKKGDAEWQREGRGGKLRPDDVWDAVKRQPLVVLDEIGTRETVSDHHYDTIKRMLDVREKMPLVVISNLDMSRLLKLYDARIASRLSAGTVLKCEGKDRRLPGKPNGD